MVQALQSFARREHPRSIAAFEASLGALHDADATVRQAAIQTLGAFDLERVRSAFKIVASLTTDPVAEVRRGTCTLLGTLGVDAMHAVFPLVKVVACDTDQEVRKAGWSALSEIDPNAKYVDLGPEDFELRSKVIEGLLHIGEPARSCRRSLEARWRQEMLPSHSRQELVVPPELRDVWERFSPEEQACLGMMWLHRRADGLPKIDLFRFLDMGVMSKKNNHLFRTRLSTIRRKLKQIVRQIPFECDRSGNVYWLPPGGR